MAQLMFPCESGREGVGIRAGGGRSLWTELIPGPRKALQLTLRICRRDIYMESYVGSNAINDCNLPGKNMFFLFIVFSCMKNHIYVVFL